MKMGKYAQQLLSLSTSPFQLDVNLGSFPVSESALRYALIILSRHHLVCRSCVTSSLLNLLTQCTRFRPFDTSLNLAQSNKQGKPDRVNVYVAKNCFLMHSVKHQPKAELAGMCKLLCSRKTTVETDLRKRKIEMQKTL